MQHRTKPRTGSALVCLLLFPALRHVGGDADAGLQAILLHFAQAPLAPEAGVPIIMAAIAIRLSSRPGGCFAQVSAQHPGARTA